MVTQFMKTFGLLFALFCVNAHAVVVGELIFGTMEQQLISGYTYEPETSTDPGYAGYTNATYRIVMPVLNNFYSVDVLYSTLYRPTGLMETNSPDPMTIQSSVEYDGTIYPVYFGNSRSLVLSNQLAYGHARVRGTATTGTNFAIRTYVEMAATNQYIPRLQPRAAQQSNVRFIPYPLFATMETNLVDSTGYVREYYYDNANYFGRYGTHFGPMAVFGNVLTLSSSRPIVLIGDSIMAGAGFSTYFMTNRPVINLAFGGEKSQMWPTNSTIRSNIIASVNADTALVLYGRNDLIAGVTTNSLIESLTNVWNNLTNMGLSVWACTIPPKTTSTDGWITTGNQTITGSNDVRIVINDWIRTTPAPLAGYIEFADAVESSRNSGLWKSGVLVQSGTATNSTATRLNSPDQTESVTGYFGNSNYRLKITSGVASGKTYVISSSVLTYIEVTTGWGGTQPSAGDTYEVYRLYSSEGVHPTTKTHVDYILPLGAGVE